MANKNNYYITDFTISRIDRLNNSSFGNPRWAVELFNNDVWPQWEVVMKTANNSRVGYKLCEQYVGQRVLVYYHSTRIGNMIIDDIKLID